MENNKGVELPGICNCDYHDGKHGCGPGNVFKVKRLEEKPDECWKNLPPRTPSRKPLQIIATFKLERFRRNSREG